MSSAIPEPAAIRATSSAPQRYAPLFLTALLAIDANQAAQYLAVAPNDYLTAILMLAQQELVGWFKNVSVDAFGFLKALGRSAKRCSRREVQTWFAGAYSDIHNTNKAFTRLALDSLSETFAGLMVFLLYSMERVAVISIPGNIARCTLSCGVNSTTSVTESFLECGYAPVNFSQPEKMAWLPMLGPATRPQFNKQEPPHSLTTVAIFTFLIYLPGRFMSLQLERKVLRMMHIKAISMKLSSQSVTARRRGSVVTSNRLRMMESGSFHGTREDLEDMASHRGTMALLGKIFSLPWSMRLMFMSVAVISYSILEGESKVRYGHE